MIEKRTLKLSRKFHGKNPDTVGKVNIPFPKSLVLLGDAVAIQYRSGKIHPSVPKGKNEYVHKFGKGVKVLTDPKGKVLFIVGGRFRVTDWLRY